MLKLKFFICLLLTLPYVAVYALWNRGDMGRLKGWDKW